MVLKYNTNTMAILVSNILFGEQCFILFFLKAKIFCTRTDLVLMLKFKTVLITDEY